MEENREIQSSRSGAHSRISLSDEGKALADRAADVRAADVIAENHEKIKATWEERVRFRVVEAHAMSSPVMVNSLGAFLDELVEILRGSDHSLTSGMTEHHGGQRATQLGYKLPQLLIEFSVLRQVLFETLNEFSVLTFEVLLKINESIDNAISLAATEFARVQKERVDLALERAEASNNELEHFASVAAHDLKSPLATMSGYLSLVRDEFRVPPESDLHQYLTVVEDSLVRMRALIDRLLEYARLSGVETPFQRIDLNDVIQSVTHNLESSLKESHAHLQFASLPQVWGERSLLSQLFQVL